MTETIQQIELSEIQESPFNPRKAFDAAALLELAASITAQGMLQPLVVRPGPTRNDQNKIMLPGHYELILGARRFRAARIVKLKAVPCIVRDLTDAAAREAQLIENAQREGITPLEEAEAFAALNRLVPDTREIASRIGKSVRYVEVRIQLLQLPAAVKKALAAEKISPSHAQELLPLKPEQQKTMFAVLKSGLGHTGAVKSVAEVREEIAERWKPKPSPKPADVERRKKFEAQEKKRRDVRTAQEKQNTIEQELRGRASERAIALLWPKLRAAGAKDRDRLLGRVLHIAAENFEGLNAALLVSQGKPLPKPNEVLCSSAGWRALHKRPVAEQIKVIVLAEAIDALEYGNPEAEEILRWAKIDRKKILADLRHRGSTAKAAQTSAAKEKGKHAPKSKAKPKPRKK